MNELTTRETRLLRSLSTPWKIQNFLNSIPYNTEPDGDTCRSPRRVMRDHLCHPERRLEPVEDGKAVTQDAGGGLGRAEPK